jgi:GT2 family glycosyltransferase
MTPLPLSVVIPTYRRESVLIDTLTALLALEPRATEILVIDQSERHEQPTEQRLKELAEAGHIQHIRLSRPSITAAMNEGLTRAAQDIVLFLDDDIAVEPELLSAHALAHSQQSGGLVAGRVIQPWQEGIAPAADEPFSFASRRPAWIQEFMGGNFSVRRRLALELGGFDENFVRVAYRFEAEFARRYCRRGSQIYFEPGACIHHLKADAGGTRSYGEHLTTWRPDHAVGAYYFSLRTCTFREFLTRPGRAIATRYHLRHPWRILPTLVAEVSGMVWAVALFLRGPKFVHATSREQGA